MPSFHTLLPQGNIFMMHMYISILFVPIPFGFPAQPTDMCMYMHVCAMVSSEEWLLQST